jgi:hypothetical protein
MTNPELTELKSYPQWENLSPQLREVLILHNAIPETFPDANKKEIRKQDFGADKEKGERLEEVLDSLDVSEREIFRDYVGRKHN